MDATPTVDSILRATQAYCVQLCEKQTLKFGIAYHCPRFPSAAALNQFREVIVENDADAERAVAEAEQFFTENGVTLRRWAPATGARSDAVEELLTKRGFVRRESHAMGLAEWPDPQPVENVRVLPARAMRAAFRSIVEADLERIDAPNRHARLEIAEERLDDPHYDAFVALIDKTPAGAITLYQVGDFARVMDLRIADASSPGGANGSSMEAGEALLAHALALAKRLTMRRVLVQVRTDDADAIALYQRSGFETDGRIVEYERTGD